MTEKIPDTSEVREAYAFSGEGVDFKRVEYAQADAFDKWLATVKADEANLIVNLIAKAFPVGAEMDYTGKEDPKMAAWVEGGHTAHDVALARYQELMKEAQA